MWVETVPCTAG